MSIKHLLDDIISNGNSETNADNNDKVVFDKDAYKEKCAFGILKDMTCAMMHNDPPENEKLLDDSIMDHIKKDCNSTCFGYLCDAKKRLNSPMLNEVIQEIEDATEEAAKEFDANGEEKKFDPTEVAKKVENYQQFKDKLTEKTSNDVVKEMSKAILNSTDAPKYDSLDKKLKPMDGPTDNENDGNSPPVTESVIMRLTETLIQESATTDTPLSTEDGMEKAICEYCVQQLAHLMKSDRYGCPYSRILNI